MQVMQRSKIDKGIERCSAIFPGSVINYNLRLDVKLIYV